MASKKFLNKTCVYCGIPSSSSTKDHVFAESFFEGVVKPSKLPQVPACVKCNNNKSDLENYLAATLPFASGLSNSVEILENSVPKRLQKNRKLHKELVMGTRPKWKFNPANGLIMPALEFIPFDNRKFAKWLLYVIKGVAFSHFNMIASDSNSIGVIILPAIDNHCLVYDEIFKRCVPVEENLSGVFSFRGVELESTIVMELKIFGGLTFDHGNKAPDRIFCTVVKNQSQNT